MAEAGRGTGYKAKILADGLPIQTGYMSREPTNGVWNVIMPHRRAPVVEFGEVRSVSLEYRIPTQRFVDLPF